MFDTYNVKGEPYCTNVTVTEKRAPTDESVKLLREMESAAKKEVLKSIRLDGNEFKGVVHISQDFMSDQYVVVAVFDLNGKRIQAEARQGTLRATADELFLRLRDAAAEQIANQIANPFIEMAQKYRLPICT
jgi:hypothetical protein